VQGDLEWLDSFRKTANLAAITVAAHGQEEQVWGQVQNTPCPSIGLGLAASQAPHAQPACICEDKQELRACLHVCGLAISLQNNKAPEHDLSFLRNAEPTYLSAAHSSIACDISRNVPTH